MTLVRVRPHPYPAPFIPRRAIEVSRAHCEIGADACIFVESRPCRLRTPACPEIRVAVAWNRSRWSGRGQKARALFCRGPGLDPFVYTFD